MLFVLGLENWAQIFLKAQMILLHSEGGRPLSTHGDFPPGVNFTHMLAISKFLFPLNSRLDIGTSCLLDF